jgi:hypothetical protein
MGVDELEEKCELVCDARTRLGLLPISSGERFSIVAAFLGESPVATSFYKFSKHRDEWPARALLFFLHISVRGPKAVAVLSPQSADVTV